MYLGLPWLASTITCLEMSTSTCLPASGYLRWNSPLPSASFLKIPGVALKLRVIPFTLRKAITARSVCEPYLLPWVL